MTKPMKKLIIATALLTVSTGTALAGESRSVTNRFTEFADVIDVQPSFRQVSLREPRQDCRIVQEQHVIGYEHSGQPSRPTYQRERRSGADTLVGGIIGGVIGNQLGRNSDHSGRAGATVAGAIIGSAIVNESQGGSSRHRREYHRPRHTQPQPIYQTQSVERCTTVYDTRYEQRVNGYNVTYEYRGQTFTTQMNRDPGSKIELQVSVKPARQ